MRRVVVMENICEYVPYNCLPSGLILTITDNKQKNSQKISDEKLCSCVYCILI